MYASFFGILSDSSLISSTTKGVYDRCIIWYKGIYDIRYKEYKEVYDIRYKEVYDIRYKV